MKLAITPKNKYLVMAGSLALAIPIAMFGGYLNKVGAKLFPQYVNYVDNVAALITIIPMIYLVFVPYFKAASIDNKDAQSDAGDN